MTILSLNHVQKTFDHETVLKDITLMIPEGSIYGFVGKNGAGKTTTMKLILGLLEKDAGSIQVMGEEVRFGNTQTNRFIGYLPDVPQFYDYLTAAEYLTICGELMGISKRKLKIKVKEMLQFVGLAEDKVKIKGFSRGMKQRLGIAQALLPEPKLLICDEPTSALDPVGRKEVLSLFQKVSQKTTVLFSTHILTDVESICDYVAILHQGMIQKNGKITDLKKEYGRHSCQIVFKNIEDYQYFLQNAKEEIRESSVRQVNDTTVEISFDPESKLPENLFRYLSDNQIIPLQFVIQQPTLEEIFMEVIK